MIQCRCLGIVYSAQCSFIYSICQASCGAGLHTMHQPMSAWCPHRFSSTNCGFVDVHHQPKTNIITKNVQQPTENRSSSINILYVLSILLRMQQTVMKLLPRDFWSFSCIIECLCFPSTDSTPIWFLSRIINEVFHGEFNLFSRFGLLKNVHSGFSHSTLAVAHVSHVIPIGMSLQLCGRDAFYFRHIYTTWVLGKITKLWFGAE